MHILITRPEPDANDLAETLTNRGHQCTISPLLQLKTLPSPIFERTDNKSIIITSRNALRALAKHPEFAKLTAMPLNLVGHQTAKLAKEMGFEKIAFIAETAAELAAHIRDNSDPKSTGFLYLTGEHLSFDMTKYLDNHGFMLKRAVLYRAEPINELKSTTQKIISDGLIDGVILLSPRTAKIYTQLIQKHHLTDQTRQATHFCLSENIGNALLKLTPLNLQIPVKPNLAALLELIEDNS